MLSYYLVVLPALILTGFGLVMGFSASAVTTILADANPYLTFATHQLVIVLVALLIAAIASFVPRRFWYSLALPTFGAALVFQLLVLTPLGASSGGNTNWLRVPGVPFLIQPSEFLKLALVIAIGRILARPGARLSDWRQMAVTVGIPIVVTLGDVMLGHDMGTAMVVGLAAIGATWVAGLPGKWFAWLCALSVPLLSLFVFMKQSRIDRVLAVLPWNTTARDLAKPEQIDHALWALGSGGLTGLGPGASREKWNYLQAAHTDFILAIIGEEFGLLGTLTVLLCIGALVWGMIRVAAATDDLFTAVVTGGVASWIGGQTVINVMSVTGVGPVIGVPLPLVSYGGSSFLFTSVAIGVVAALARQQAGMFVFGSPDESSAGRDPRRGPRRRSSGARRRGERVLSPTVKESS
ncbi:FtsW/RodA/SpoVE family cell cycle protein [Schaalia sp. 19OD2882]|nr:FtsW/RodA/SpoVE family cell cycle protein [Schaalia sp. 19OD2882]